MSENFTTQNEGFEEESGSAEASAVVPGGRRSTRASQKTKFEVAKANLGAVFGQGPGRIAAIAVVVVLVLFIALSIRGLTHHQGPSANTAKVDVPQAPTAEITAKPVSQQEAERHAAVSAQEAADARSKGASYQASFDPRIAAEKSSAASQDQNSNRGATGNAAQGVNNAASAGQAGQGGAQASQAEIDAAKARQDAYDKAVSDRDKYVTDNQKRVLDQIQEIIDDPKDQKEGAGGYKSFSYIPEKPQAGATPASAALAGVTALGGVPQTPTVDPKPATPVQKGPPLIKTGNSLYATNNSLINTDHGNKVFMTVQGGPWDGAQLIGALEQTPDNISVHFTTMAPQDSRPTMKIDAVALREEDASLGVAEDIDHHTLSRYSALAASSLLQGYGEAYTYQQGTSVVTAAGTVLQTSDSPSTKQVVGRSVGQMGTAIAAEVQKGFDRPTTYSTPAQHGFVIYFLSDVYTSSTSN